ncbi:uncharacterized protein LOC128961428 [Oppia nitens]|uniref:uncharacterized protein LOC128961428 n=1 Tax=Oppia nitens TaxID=1686743 RepID=UPI0023DA9750|nr:uncharacterized protein LOC128961428 [Oppia nitens]
MIWTTIIKSKIPDLCLAKAMMTTMTTTDKIDIQTLRDRHMKSILLLQTFSLNNSTDYLSHGTGVLVDNRANLVLTNYHVVRGLVNVSAVFNFSYRVDQWTDFPSEKGEWKVESTDTTIAKVLYVEPHRDLALIQLQHMITGALPAMQLSDRSQQLGEPVVFMGTARGLPHTMCEGIVSTVTPLNRISFTSFVPLADQMSADEQFVIHYPDTAPGFSGSPMIAAADDDYNIIGIHFAGLALGSKPQVTISGASVIEFMNNGYNYANSVTADNQITERLKRYKPVVVVSGSSNIIGIVLANDSINGFVVTDFLHHYTSDIFELQVNDVIIEINGQMFSNIRQLSDIINDPDIIYGLDDDFDDDFDMTPVIKLKIRRNNGEMSAKVGFKDIRDDMPSIF